MASWLVVGLGNPGPSYARNRHNIGAMVVHELARRGSVSSWKSRRMLRADTAEVRLGAEGVGVPSVTGERVILATTRTFMNLSGVVVRNLVGDLKIKQGRLIVVHDELDLDLGVMRAKNGGGDNGHNGLKSIRAMVGSGEYFRVRVGIGRPTGRMDVTDWVLTNFRSGEMEVVDQMVSLAADACESLMLHGLEVTQGRYNS